MADSVRTSVMLRKMAPSLFCRSISIGIAFEPRARRPRLQQTHCQKRPLRV